MFQYIDLNWFEWTIFGLSLFLIAGLLFMFPACKALAQRKLGIDNSDNEDK